MFKFVVHVVAVAQRPNPILEFNFAEAFKLRIFDTLPLMLNGKERWAVNTYFYVYFDPT